MNPPRSITIFFISPRKEQVMSQGKYSSGGRFAPGRYAQPPMAAPPKQKRGDVVVAWIYAIIWLILIGALLGALWGNALFEYWGYTWPW